MGVMEFEVGSGGGPPPGTYRGTFLGVEATSHEEFGPGLRWTWRVIDGPQAGVIASRTTSPTPTVANACGKLIGSMIGSQLTGGQKASVAGLVGKTFILSVMTTKSGNGTRVETALPAS